MREGQTVYTYFHLAADKPLTKALLERKVTAVAYETIQTDDGQLPLLKPMSEVAGPHGGGRWSGPAGEGARRQGGAALRRSGVRRGKVVILGAAPSGPTARSSPRMGADTVILDVNTNRLAYLDDIFGSRITPSILIPTRWRGTSATPTW